MKRAYIEVDSTAQAVYVNLGVGERGVASTVEVLPNVNVDLDEYDVAVGIEVLTLSLRGIPLSELTTKCHFREEDQALVRKLPDIIEQLAGNASASQPDGEGTPVGGDIYA